VRLASVTQASCHLTLAFWKCGTPRRAVSRDRIPLAPRFSYNIREFVSGGDRNVVELRRQLRPLMPTDATARIAEAMRLERPLGRGDA
jgi:hypothetical protein